MSGRPGLPANFGVGSKVIVTIPKVFRQGDEEFNATVTAASRVWLTIEADANPHQRWRMRRDTQQEKVTMNTPGAGTYQARFVTPEQRAYDQRMQAARELLRVEGVAPSLGYAHLWPDADVLALADFVHTLRTNNREEN